MSLGKVLNSDRFNYQRALALQRLARNPDDVIMEIKYHFAWNVVGQRAIFSDPETMINDVMDTIALCNEAIGSFVGLLWLAPDHIHVYVESDGEESPDTMAKELKRISETDILERIPNLIKSLGSEAKLWDEAYFVETISGS